MELSEDNLAPNVYHTLDPVSRDLLGRAYNRITEVESLTADKNVVRLATLYVDADPHRVNGISATEEGHSLAIQRCRNIRDVLIARGWPQPILGDSGNGGHCLWRLDLDLTDQNVELRKRCLQALNLEFGDSTVADQYDDRLIKVDTTTFNPSRIGKVYGTWARKGDSTPERPHRIARLLEVPEMVEVPRELLEQLAKWATPSKTTLPPLGNGALNMADLRAEANRLAGKGDPWTQGDLLHWLEHHGMGHREPREVGDRIKVVLDHCPFDESHRAPDSAVFLDVAGDNVGRLGFKCFHESCAGRGWTQLREKLDGPREERPQHQHHQEHHEEGAKEKGAKPDIAKALVGLALDNAELFRDDSGEPYATVQDDGIRRTLPVDGPAFSSWLKGLLYDRKGKIAKREPLKDAVGIVAHEARRKPRQSVYLRVANLGDKIVIDLGDDRWHAVEITAAGWKVVDSTSVRFRRGTIAGPLPIPKPGGSIDLLRPYLGTSDENWTFILGFLLNAMSGAGPFFNLTVSGEQGSVKSTVCRVMKRLIDPASKAELGPIPKDGEGFAVSAHHEYLLAFDNVSRLDQDQSDALCALATGGGWKTRQLYSDHEISAFDYKRPVTMNGIPDYADKGDLLQRSLRVLQPGIPEGERKTEKELWENWERDAPLILGALFSLLAVGLKNLPGTHPRELPRMADAARWVTACLGDSSFLEALAEAQEENDSISLSTSPVAPILQRFLTTPDKFDPTWKCGHWRGEPGELREQLVRFAQGNSIPLSKYFPEAPNRFSGQLRRDAPALRSLGFDVSTDRRCKGRRMITIQPVADTTPETPEEPSMTPTREETLVTPPAQEEPDMTPTREEIIVIPPAQEEPATDTTAWCHWMTPAWKENYRKECLAVLEKNRPYISEDSYQQGCDELMKTLISA